MVAQWQPGPNTYVRSRQEEGKKGGFFLPEKQKAFTFDSEYMDRAQVAIFCKAYLRMIQPEVESSACSDHYPSSMAPHINALNKARVLQGRGHRFG